MLEFAQWHRAKTERRAVAARDPGRRRRGPEPGWLSAAEAAPVLGVLPSEASHLAKVGRLTAIKVDGRWWLNEQAVHERVVEERRWSSSVDAAAIMGCSAKTILAHAKAGDVEQRHTDRGRPRC